MATFFSALSTLASGLVNLASGASGPFAEVMTFAITKPLGILVLSSLATFGMFCSWMSNRESTELRIVQDEHMAQRMAKNGHEKTVTAELAVEQSKTVSPNPVLHVVSPAAKKTAPQEDFPQNKRADGQQWRDVIRSAKEAGQSVPPLH